MNTNPYGKIFAVYRWRSLLTGVLILGGLLGAGIAESASLYVGVSPSPAAATVTPGYTNVSTFGTIPLVATDISPAYTFSYWALYACTVPAYAEINNSISNHTVYIKVADTNDDAESFATAVYVNNLCTLVVASSPTNGGFTSPAGSNTYLKGTTVSVSETPSAVPAPGYEFLGWSGAPYTPLFGNSIQVVMDSDYSLTASFIKLWKLSQSFRLGPSDNIPFVFSLRDQVYTNISIPSVIAEQSDSQRFRCNGWSDGSGSVIPISRSGANFTSISLISTTNSGLTWSWAQQYKVDATNTEEGYITIQELSSDNDPNDRWADTGTSVRVSSSRIMCWSMVKYNT